MSRSGELAEVIDLSRYRRANRPKEDFMEFLRRFDDVDEDEDETNGEVKVADVPIGQEVDLGESFWHSFYNSDD